MRETQTGVHCEHDNECVADGQQENEDMSKLERKNDVLFAFSSDFVDDKREGHDAQNHQLSVEHFENWFNVVMAVTGPMLDLVKDDLEEERHTNKHHQKPF